jgi:translocation and assembly module TamB
MLKHPEADFDGAIQAEANMLGSLMQPKISGRLNLTDGYLNFDDQGLTYETVEGDLRFSPGRITIVDARMSGDTEGSLQIDGEAGLEGVALGEFDIRVSGRDFYLPYQKGVDVKVRPDLRLSGSLAEPELTGEVKVTQGRVDLDLFLEKQPSEIRVIEPPKAENGILQIPERTPERLKLIAPLAADVSVSIPNNMWFRSKDQYVEITGDIDLKKVRGEQFLIYGPLNVVRGTYRFRGKLFEITRGEINFIGQETINPPVRFQAETEIQDVTIIIHLSGTFQQLNLDLESIPAMERVDIISYLAFGRPSGELSSAQSFKAEQAALSITGQLAADEFRQLLSDILYIDYLNISAGSGDLRQGSVAMGKYVTPNVFVTYRQGFSEESPRQLAVDYEINRHFSIETQIDEEQTAGVDLIWNHEF